MPYTYIAPPDADVQSDEDSAQEDEGGLIDNLSSRQLNAPAELAFSNTYSKTGKIPIQDEAFEVVLDNETDEQVHDSLSEHEVVLPLEEQKRNQ